jgi:SPP1 family predicted phage head-tail adaptor
MTYLPGRRGERRHLISIKEITPVADDKGGFDDTTLSVKTTRWAAIYPINAKERAQNKENEVVITHRIQFDYVSGLLPSMKVFKGTTEYRIKSIINKEERDIEHQILCEEYLQS